MSAAPAPDVLEGLDDLLPLTRTVTAGGRQVEVRPISPRQLRPVVQALVPLQAAIGGGLDLGAVPRAELLALVAEHADNVITLVAAATRLPEPFVADEIDLAELVELAAAVLEVNADFFARRMAPALHQLMAAVPRPPAGPTPSSA